MPVPYREVSHDAALALTEFSSEFDAALALGEAETWAARIGIRRVSKAVRTVFPLPLSAAGYKKREGDDKLRHLYERSLSLTTMDWYDGVEEFARVIEAPDFIGWTKEPANIAFEAQRLENVLIADLLATNANIDFYRYEMPGGSVASAKGLFNATHPVNVFESRYGTFDNDIEASAINVALVVALKEYFRSIKGPNGRSIGLQLAEVLVPPAQAEEWRDLLERDIVLEALQNVAGTENVAAVPQKNRHYMTVKVTVADELVGELPSGASGSDSVLYAIGARSNGSRPAPWVIQDTGTPEEVRYDKDSDFYKNSGKVGVKYNKTVGVAGALPQAIARVTLS